MDRLTSLKRAVFRGAESRTKTQSLTFHARRETGSLTSLTPVSHRISNKDAQSHANAEPLRLESHSAHRLFIGGCDESETAPMRDGPTVVASGAGQDSRRLWWPAYSSSCSRVRLASFAIKVRSASGRAATKRSRPSRMIRQPGIPVTVAAVVLDRWSPLALFWLFLGLALGSRQRERPLSLAPWPAGVIEEDKTFKIASLAWRD